MKEMKVVLAGLGVVGEAFVELLIEKEAYLLDKFEYLTLLIILLLSLMFFLLIVAANGLE